MLSETNIIRHIDDLGRLSIPRDIRRELRIHENDPFVIQVDREKRGVMFVPYYSWEESLLKEVTRIVAVLHKQNPSIKVNMYQGNRHLYDPINKISLEDVALDDNYKEMVKKLAQTATMHRCPEYDYKKGIVVIPICAEKMHEEDGFIVGRWNMEYSPIESEIDKFASDAATLVAYFTMLVTGN